MEPIDLETKKFILAIRYRALADNNFFGPSRKSVMRLMMEIKGRLANEKNRKRVLQAITGLPIASQKELTQYYTSVLIDEIITNPNSIQILRKIEELAEKQSGKPAWNLFPTAWLETDLPYLQ